MFGCVEKCSWAARRFSCSDIRRRLFETPFSLKFAALLAFVSLRCGLTSQLPALARACTQQAFLLFGVFWSPGQVSSFFKMQDDNFSSLEGERRSHVTKCCFRGPFAFSDHLRRNHLLESAQETTPTCTCDDPVPIVLIHGLIHAW